MAQTNPISIHQALISVSDKDGINDFACALAALNVEIIATGGTAKYLQSLNLPIVEVSQYTQFPEILAGRVKTLHPKIFGGILQRGAADSDELSTQNIQPIDLVIVNLYPFKNTIEKQHSLEEAIENIDIGGVSLIRAAAKNYHHVVIITDIQDYQKVLAELTHTQQVSYATRLALAQKAFAYTAEYDRIIANYFHHSTESARDGESEFPDILALQWHKQTKLRYGENPHQQAALYQNKEYNPGTLAFAKLLQGKELSYNNLLDADTAWQCVQTFQKPTCVIVKHANPCGVAEGVSIRAAYRLAYETDPQSAFGGIIAFNRKIDHETAHDIISTQFAEVIIAPEIDEQAQLIFSNKANIRVLECGYGKQAQHQWQLHTISGGVLVQEVDQLELPSDQLKVVTQRSPTQIELEDMLFAWQVVKFVKSNAIVMTRNNQTLGIGAGQSSRVYSVKLAGQKAKDSNLFLSGAVMASDAFFPFRDNIDDAAKLGIQAIIQPGGSIRDEEVIKAADELGIAMIFTGIRHFRH